MKKKFEEEMEIARDEIELEPVIVKSKTSWDDMDSDYKIMREAIMKAIIRSSEVLDEATKMVKACPLPNQITAASTVIKSIAENAEKLLLLHEKIRKIEIDYEEDDTKEKEEKKVVGVKTNLSEILRVVNGKNS